MTVPNKGGKRGAPPSQFLQRPTVSNDARIVALRCRQDHAVGKAAGHHAAQIVARVLLR